VGGLGTAFGPLVGSMAAIPLHHAMGALGDSFGIPGLNSIAYGAVLILVVWFLPDGIWPAVVRLYGAIQLPARVRILKLEEVENDRAA
jgi:branched-chain amino acid transport system permease protein